MIHYMPKERDVSQHECSFDGHRRQLSCSSFWAGKILYWSCAHPRGISANSPLSWPLSLRMHRLPLLNLLMHAKMHACKDFSHAKLTTKTAAGAHVDWTFKRSQTWCLTREKKSRSVQTGCKTAVCDVEEKKASDRWNVLMLAVAG